MATNVRRQRAPADPGAWAEVERAAIDELRRGDLDRALGTLMAAFGAAVYRHCCHVVGDPMVAMERIRRRVLKLRRRWLRRFTLRGDLPEAPDPGKGGEEQLRERDQQAALARALGTLKPKVRIAVLLRFQEDMSYEEMAVICGEKPATLQARVARALPMLRRLLEDEGVRDA